MFKRIQAFFAPFYRIAAELQAIRELYELDLASRQPPIIRVTESPSRHDTEVSYMGEEDKPKGFLERLRDQFEASGGLDEDD